MTTEASFGAWVRQRRKDLDLIQTDVARQVGCSVAALQKIERDERRPSRQLAERLATCLQVPPEERARFVQVARRERRVEVLNPLPTPPTPTPSDSGPRPQLAPLFPPTPLFGREAELVEIERLLRDPQCRLLTLVGPGGIGKTRLALETMARQDVGDARAVIYVALAPILDREAMITAIADALGIVLYNATDRAEQLIHYLRDRAALLVLDNFEQLLGEPACAILVAALLRGASGLRVLVTSREPLSLQLEWVFDVHGLPLPVSDGADELDASSAARLFLQRARQTKVGLQFSADERQAILQICRLVEGLPLALELAAGWVRTLSCQEIALEIQRTMDVLATPARDVPERHRSIRAVFDQSWALLSPEEQRALRSLAVFRGDFGREGAEHVTGASLPLLAALVSKSLLRRSATGRYDIHELVRQYALEHLNRDPEEYAALRARHCAYYAELLERRGPVFKGPDQPAVSAELMAELANLRLSWDWAIAQCRVNDISRSSDTLFWLYESQSNSREGVPLFGQAVQRLQTDADLREAVAGGRGDEWQLALGQVLSYQGFFCFRQGQHPQGRALLQRAVALLQPLANGSAGRAALSNALAFLGMVTYMMGANSEGRGYLREALAIKREQSDSWGIAVCLRHLGLAAYAFGEYDEAYQLLRESLAVSRALGNPWSIAFSLNFLGIAAHARGTYDEAQQLLAEGLAISMILKDRYNIATAQSSLGMVHSALGEHSAAQRAFQQSIAIWREIGEQGNLAQTLNQFGQTLLASGDGQAARRCFCEALDVAKMAQIAPVELAALLGLAILHAQTGSVETALTLVAYILRNAASTRATHDRAEQLHAELTLGLSPAQREAVDAQIRHQTLDGLVAQILSAT